MGVRGTSDTGMTSRAWSKRGSKCSPTSSGRSLKSAIPRLERKQHAKDEMLHEGYNASWFALQKMPLSLFAAKESLGGRGECIRDAIPGSVFLVQSDEKTEPDWTPGSIVGRTPTRSRGEAVSRRWSRLIHE